MSNLKTFFAECTRLVDEKLEKMIPNPQISPVSLHSAMRWSLFAGGKRFRPALVMAVGKTFGAPEKNLLQTAAAIEMIHTYSLIHDDLPAMDNDDLRRGRETCHRKYDEATAILAGDALQNLAFKTIAEDANLSAEIKIRLISEISESAAQMVDGQQLDLEAEGVDISVEDLENIHRNKTGAMICASARSGAIIAGADEIQLAAITKYAANLGLLFQITDDLLDVTQTSEMLGKTAGKDEKTKKATYVSLYGLEKAAKLAENVHAESRRELEKIDKDTDLLREIASFILHRKK